MASWRRKNNANTRKKKNSFRKPQSQRGPGGPMQSEKDYRRKPKHKKIWEEA
jgi:hypothetical protein